MLATLEGIEESPRELTAYEFTTAAPADAAPAIEAPAAVEALIEHEDLIADIDPEIRSSL